MAQTKLENAIEHYKIDSGKTNDDIAKELGVTRATLWSKIHGLTPINFEQAKQLADMLGVSLEAFYVLVPKMDGQ